GFFGASTEVTADEFTAFSQQVLPASTIVVQALYAPLITHAQRPAFEAWLKTQGVQPDVITQIQPDGHRRPVPPREDYYPVIYRARVLDMLQDTPIGIESFGANRAGYEAIKRNETYASDPVTL